MIIAVAGGRDFDDRELLDRVLTEALQQDPDMRVITGCAKGADRMTCGWACRNSVPYQVFRADWNRYGKAAGPNRNHEIIHKGNPDILIAFPGGVGTADIVRRAEVAGIPVIRQSRERMERAENLADQWAERQDLQDRIRVAGWLPDE